MLLLSFLTRTAKSLGMRLLRVNSFSPAFVLAMWLAPAVSAQVPSPIPDAVPMAERLNHWAWQPLGQTVPPLVGDSAAGQQAGISSNPIDAFVAHKLAEAGLSFSSQAKASEQLRRLWFDLVGLPPTPEAIDRFSGNPSDANYRHEVDLLLASPRFGERWARHWLDLVRYSETLGHEFDFEIPNAWRYRDYVIRALNEDVPYHQFVREHIAGDLLDHPRCDAAGNNESVQATASWWFVEQTHSPVDSLQHQADRIDNQIDVFGKAFLGMTVACARCHDHKFDAIPTRDYYSLFGFVQSSRYVQAPLKEVPPTSAPYQSVLQRQRELAKQWVSDAPSVASGISYRPDDFVIADANDASCQWYVTNDAFGAEPWRGPFCANASSDKPQLRQLPGAFWLSAAAGSQREGTVATATFSLDQRYVHVRVAGDHCRIKLIVDGFHIVRNPIYGGLHANVDNQSAHWVTFDVGMWPGHTGHLQVIDQRAPDLGDPRHDRGHYPDHCWIAIQAVVSSLHSSPPETQSLDVVTDASAVKDKQAWDDARLQLVKAIDALPVSPTIPAMADGSGIDSYVYLRGDHKIPGERAPRQFLSALDAQAEAAPRAASGRLQLAESVLAASNPLPARVMVNRLWHHLFGRGLVKSVDNFGALGESPTHPEMLDWLANDFIVNGWSIKQSIRKIVMSKTYRQSSQVRKPGLDRDPENRLLHRQSVRPLQAEVLRDALLSISGRLDVKMYGPSIEQPKEAVTNARGKPRHHDPRDGHGRRSIYLAVRRNFMPEMMLAFDAPTPFATVGRRNTSNVPAQALALANAPIVHDLSVLFAKRCIAFSDRPKDRLQLAYQLAFGRNPRAQELARLLAFVRQDGAELTIWTDALHALINTTEFRFLR